MRCSQYQCFFPLPLPLPFPPCPPFAEDEAEFLMITVLPPFLCLVWPGLVVYGWCGLLGFLYQPLCRPLSFLALPTRTFLPSSIIITLPDLEVVFLEEEHEASVATAANTNSPCFKICMIWLKVKYFRQLNVKRTTKV